MVATIELRPWFIRNVEGRPANSPIFAYMKVYKRSSFSVRDGRVHINCWDDNNKVGENYG